jgi:hypothetical protein
MISMLCWIQGRTGRAGNTGAALSFVNERNSGVVRELRELLEENGQEVPHWLNQMSSYGGRGGSGGGGGRGRELVCQLLLVVSNFALLFARIVLLNLLSMIAML